MIILKKGVFDTEVQEFSVVVSLKKSAARVAMDCGTQFIHTWQGGFDSLHRQRIYACSF